MHAVIKIVSFLVFGAAVTLGYVPVLLAAGVLLAVLYLPGHARLAPAWQMLRRLRWLFVSILAVYLFFTPGQLLWPALAWGPTVEGMNQGILRISALMLLVLAVNWVIDSTAQADFLSAILWCLRPLAWLGLPHQRLAVRITLTIEWVASVREIYRQQAVAGPPAASRLAMIAQRGRQLVEEVVRRAQAAPLREISLPAESRPPLLQWLIPLTLAGLFAAVRYFGESWLALFAGR